MICSSPFGNFDCGRCMPCRVNRQRLWSARIVLESGSHSVSCFATLTYSDEFVPKELEERHLTLFLKRLRRELEPRKIRFYAAGEYGSKNGRPHFHVCLFGVSPLEVDVISKAWGMGFVHVGELNQRTATYCAKYITKKWISHDKKDPRHGDRRSEFSRMSRRPNGIGAAAIEATIASIVANSGATRAISEAGDVPSSVRIGSSRHPLGKYLRSRVREGIGWDSGAPEEVRRALSLNESRIAPAEKDYARVKSAAKAQLIMDIADQKRRL